jgi:AcrR family transcriptional regulator
VKNPAPAQRAQQRRRGRPRAESPARLRERVLSTLKERLDATGEIVLSMDGIAAGLRMSKKTLYTVFDSREDLVRQLVGLVLTETGGRIEAIVAADERLAQKLSRLLTFLSFVFRRMDSELGKELHFRMPEVWRSVEQFRERKLQENVSKLLEQGVREQVIRPGLDRQLFLMAFIAASQALIRPSTLLDESRSPQQVVAQLLTMMYTGIMTDAGREEFFAATQHSTSA